MSKIQDSRGGCSWGKSVYVLHSVLLLSTIALSTLQAGQSPGYIVMARHITFDQIIDILNSETIASGRGVHVRHGLDKRFGRGKWRKMKGAVLWQHPGDGKVYLAEVHWFEAHGVGRYLPKLIRYLEQES
ncbi:MAG: hypothetical protein KDE47_28710 [Caldilineaceae bacterium]|nr:hypothetical protein [Caldilineaceae bacterium]